jgi:hypothetical protein
MARDAARATLAAVPSRSFKPPRRRTPRRSHADADAAYQKAVAQVRERRLGYRERSLALHGWICAKCAREFDQATLHLLTVHHKDGNHRNNPADGSNWENLCADCHEAEYSRDLLGDYLTGKS